jgi:hypothetical protein
MGDPVLGKEQHLRFLPSRFTVEGQAIDARGLACHGLACPRCHLPLPRAMIDQTPLFLSILGSPASGKSYYLAAMTWQLRRLLKQHFNVAFGDADPTANLILNQYEERLFLNGTPDEPTLINKTDLEGNLYNSVRIGDQVVDLPCPFVFSLKPLQGHPNAHNAERVSRALCLYDNAGEHYQPGVDTARRPGTRHLALSRALLFLFDPTQDPRFRDACHKLSADPQMRDRARTYRQETVLSEAADRIRTHSGMSPRAKHNRPLIVVVTKYDAWSSLLPRERLQLDQALRETRSGMRALDLGVVDHASRLTRGLLEQHSPEIISAAESFADRVVYLPVSALGCAPEKGAGEFLVVRPRNIKPQWVEIPMYYALLASVPGLIPIAPPTTSVPLAAPNANQPAPPFKVWRQAEP